MTEPVITTKDGYKFDREAILSAKDIFFGDKIPTENIIGYFANNSEELCDAVDTNDRHILDHWEVNPYPFFTNKHNYAFFLPVDAVRRASKQYRPFKTISEFSDAVFRWVNTPIGKCIVYRSKTDTNNILYQKFNGFQLGKDSLLISVTLGFMNIDVKTLFNEYEYQGYDGKWHCFGKADS